jgi:hypothetical protein
MLKLESFTFDDLAWEALMLPINLAFFLRRPDGETQAVYPSPGGAMLSQIALPRWNEMFAQEAALLTIEPEVEALLVCRIGERPRYFVAPLDACYRLVGVIRTTWRGLSGGTEVWREITAFFEELERKAKLVGKAAHD